MSNTLVKFKNLYRDFAKADLSQLGEIYCENATFKDPVHCLKGLPDIRAYFSNTSKGLLFCRFEFLEMHTHEGGAWVRWRMDYAHGKLKGGQALQLDGASQLRLEQRDGLEKIVFHEDFYDMGAMLYEHVPVLNWLIKSLKKRLALA